MSEIPYWLNSIIDEICEEDAGWPSGEYPSLAFKVMEMVGGNDDPDDYACLVQMLIDEVESLKEQLDVMCKKDD